MDRKDRAKAVAKIHAKCWSDPAFRERFKSDPHSVLKEHGLNAPDGLTVNVHEEAPGQAHWVIPERPDGVTDEQLQGDPSPNICSFFAHPDICSNGDDGMCWGDS